MAKITELVLKVNGVVADKSLNTKKLFKALMTQNPGAKTPVDALKELTANPTDWIMSVRAGGESSDVVEIFESKESEKPFAKSTRGKIARYAEITLDVENWLPETFGETSATPADNSKAESI